MQRYKLLGTLLLALLATTCSAQLEVPLGGSHSGDNTPTRKTRPTSRTLTGAVLDKRDRPISDAIVYLKNTKTLAVKTYISQNDGSYRFPELSLNADYEVYAEKEGKKSKTKTVSQFDDRPAPHINLQIDEGK